MKFFGRTSVFIACRQTATLRLGFFVLAPQPQLPGTPRLGITHEQAGPDGRKCEMGLIGSLATVFRCMSCVKFRFGFRRMVRPAWNHGAPHRPSKPLRLSRLERFKPLTSGS